MDVELGHEADAAEREAVRQAVAVALPTTSGGPRPWWRAGLDEVRDRAPTDRPRPSSYDAVRSPRSTPGATRA
jgi:hypothetical protein